jgi:hypothetical protein
MTFYWSRILIINHGIVFACSFFGVYPGTCVGEIVRNLGMFFPSKLALERYLKIGLFMISDVYLVACLCARLKVYTAKMLKFARKFD